MTGGPGLPLPPGYRALQPFDVSVEGKLGVPEARRFGFAGTLNAIYLTVSEFFQAARHYPIAFAEDASGERLPVAITALELGRNLFVSARGEWRRGAYVPAYVRRYPFYTVEARREGAAAGTIVCVDPSGLSPRAAALFDHRGEPTAAWRRFESLVNEMETARRLTREFCARLSDAGILERFDAQAHPRTGNPRRLTGLLRADEDRLNRLPAPQIQDLMQRGHLSRIYAHLMSLDNFAALVEGNPGG